MVLQKVRGKKGLQGQAARTLRRRRRRGWSPAALGAGDLALTDGRMSTTGFYIVWFLSASPEPKAQLALQWGVTEGTRRAGGRGEGRKLAATAQNKRCLAEM